MKYNYVLNNKDICINIVYTICLLFNTTILSLDKIYTLYIKKDLNPWYHYALVGAEGRDKTESLPDPTIKSPPHNNALRPAKRCFVPQQAASSASFHFAGGQPGVKLVSLAAQRDNVKRNTV